MTQRLRSSFRDNDGFVFEHKGRILRQVSRTYEATYAKLKASGFYARLHEQGWLIPHREMPAGAEGFEGIVLDPDQLQVITYPFEWSFGQLRDAALLTLQIQKTALTAGFSLKGASAYNIQFH